MINDIIILGSTGSIGTQSLDVCRKLGLKVNAISGNNNDKLLEQQCREFQPAVCWVSEQKYASLKTALADTAVKVITSDSALDSLAYEQKADLLLNSLMGIRGLKPTLAAIES
jgi:1-deoxy-D-xylulose-5-phosphate reductoisomerase